MALLSQQWHKFIDDVPSLVLTSLAVDPQCTSGHRAFRRPDKLYSRYISDSSCWRDLRQRYQRLDHALWDGPQLKTRDSFIPLRDSPWSFIPDFARRLVVCISPGVTVTFRDMDTGALALDWTFENPRIWMIQCRDGYVLLPIPVEDFETDYAIEIWRFADDDPRRLERHATITPVVQFSGFHFAFPYLFVLGAHSRQTWRHDIRRPKSVPQATENDGRASPGPHMESNDQALMLSYDGTRLDFVSLESFTPIHHISPSNLKKPQFFHIDPRVHKCGKASAMPTPAKAHLEKVELREGPAQRLSYSAKQSARLSSPAKPAPFEKDMWVQSAFDGDVFISRSSSGRLLILPKWTAWMAKPEQVEHLAVVIEMDIYAPERHAA